MRTRLVSLMAIAGICTAATSSAATYKVAWYNIQSGNGEQPLSGHTVRQAFHHQFNIAVKPIASYRYDFNGHCNSTAKCKRFGNGIAIAIAKFHMKPPSSQREVGSRITRLQLDGRPFLRRRSRF